MSDPKPQDDTNIFQHAAREKYLEDKIPRLKQVHEHDKNLTKDGVLELNTLEVGDQVTLDFYPTKNDPEPEQMTLVVKKVNETSIKAIASGGPKNWVDVEVGLGHSTFGGSMAKAGVLEVGLYPEFHYFDPEFKKEEQRKIEEIYSEHGLVYIRGIKFDQDFFDFRKDLKLDTKEKQIEYMQNDDRLGRNVLNAEALAAFKVDKPIQVSI